MNNNNKGSAPIVLAVVLAIAIIGGGVFYFLNKRTTVPSSIISTPAEDQTPIKQGGQAAENIFPISRDELKEWKTYTNTQYGFELKYPPSYTITKNTARDPDLLSIRIEDIDVRITKKTGLRFHGLGSESLFYDNDLNAWLAFLNFDEEEKGFHTLACPTVTIGKDKLVAYRTGWGDAGHFKNDFYILTDKNFAVVLTRWEGPISTEESIRNQEKILGSFRLLPGTNVKTAICDNTKIGRPASFPSVVSPTNGSVIKISQPFNVTLSSNLSPGVGAAVYISKNRDNISYVSAFGELTSGRNLSLKPLSQFLFNIMIPDFSGNAYLHVKFYKIVNGKKIFSDNGGQQVINLFINNDLPSILELSVNEVVAQNYQKRNGKVVLKRGSNNEGILKIRASNIKDCVSVINSMNKGAPSEFGAILDGTQSIFVDSDFPSSQPVIVTYTCKTPTGVEITKTIEFVSD